MGFDQKALAILSSYQLDQVKEGLLGGRLLPSNRINNMAESEVLVHGGLGQMGCTNELNTKANELTSTL